MLEILRTFFDPLGRQPDPQRALDPIERASKRSGRLENGPSAKDILSMFTIAWPVRAALQNGACPDRRKLPSEKCAPPACAVS
jgi:hypothetical protein